MAVKHQKIACPQASLNRMCRLLGKSKQAYYKQQKTVPKLILKAEKRGNSATGEVHQKEVAYAGWPEITLYVSPKENTGRQGYAFHYSQE